MNEFESTPRALGYRAVPEWQENRACWSAWPAHDYAWGDFLSAAQGEYTAFCHALLRHDGAELLELLVPDSAAEAAARSALALLGPRVNYRRMAAGDVWLRDTTPILVRKGRELGCVRFAFNGWGEKYLYPGDEDLAARMCALLGLPQFAFDLITEGGALEFDGEGTCLTTDSCLCGDNRGGRTRAEVEAVLRDAFAIDAVLWLGEGLRGDHTDGHIDNLARFVAPGVVMHSRPSGPEDPNGSALDAIAAELGSARDAVGRSLRLFPIPSPGQVLGSDGAPLAASYLNFYLGNRSVVVPAFGTAYDEPARAAIAAFFTERDVISSPARAILEGGGGTFHCMTRQEPRA